MLKCRLNDEGSELYTNCVQLKIKFKKNGNLYKTDTLDTKRMLRIIESIPSTKTEPFKIWLANLGNEWINEIFDLEKAVITKENVLPYKNIDENK